MYKTMPLLFLETIFIDKCAQEFYSNYKRQGEQAMKGKKKEERKELAKNFGKSGVLLLLIAVLSMFAYNAPSAFDAVSKDISASYAEWEANSKVADLPETKIAEAKKSYRIMTDGESFRAERDYALLISDWRPISNYMDTYVEAEEAILNDIKRRSPGLFWTEATKPEKEELGEAPVFEEEDKSLKTLVDEFDAISPAFKPTSKKYLGYKPKK